jgi:hypothetical protein
MLDITLQLWLTIEEKYSFGEKTLITRDSEKLSYYMHLEYRLSRLHWGRDMGLH